MCNSFKNKIIQFWKSFEEEESIIRQMIDNNVTGKALTNFTESILRTVFDEVQFQIGVNLENKYELTLSPQGDRVKLIQYYYWSKYVPSSLNKKWTFHSSKPALKNSQYKVEMFGLVLDKDDLIIYPDTDYFSSKIRLQVYCPKLEDKSDSQKYAIFFILLDQYISELYSIEYINNIQFISTKLDSKALRLDELKVHIDLEINRNGWLYNNNPLKSFIGYNVQPSTSPNWILREDIYAGYSSCTAAISAYHFKDDTFFKKYQVDGIVFGFIFYENADIPHEKLVPFRGVIEDAIIEQCATNGIADCIGGATGTHFSYIDFIIYDWTLFVKIAKDTLSRYTFDEAGISYFSTTSKPLLLSEMKA